MVRTKMAMWWTWARIAVRATATAVRARNDGVPAWTFKSAKSASLSAEFERSLMAIAACAFAMEALSKELEGSGHQLDKSKIGPTGKVTAGFYVGHRLVQAFNLEEPLASSLPTRLDDVFRLRNDGVHFESSWREGAHLHPRGTHTAYEITVYTMERAIDAIRMVRVVLVAIQEVIAENRHDSAADHIAREIPGVLQMFDAVVKDEGLSGYLEEYADG